MLRVMRTIAAVTTSRADWGHLEPVLRALVTGDDVTVQLLVGGAHLDVRFGHTIDAIEAAGYAVTARIPFVQADDSDEAMGVAIGEATTGFSRALAKLRPDMLLLIADRYEMLAPAAAALALRIPIAHIEGGEISEGAIDQQVRDALTKMSHLHLAPTEDAAERVIAMGEEPWRVTVTGAPSLDHLVLDELPSRADVAETVGLSLDPAPVVVAMHPTTMHRDTTYESEVFFAAMHRVEAPLVFCFPNADAGYSRIIALAESVCARRDDAVLKVNLDHLLYWALLREASVLAGNSSSGIMEAASLNLPVVNVGIRQQGRTRAANVIDVDADEDAIVAAMHTAIEGGRVACVNPYGDGTAGVRIADVLQHASLDRGLFVKQCSHLTPA